MLRQHFEQFGGVEEVLIMQDPMTKRSRGFAFVTFQSLDTIARVLAQNEHYVDGRRVRQSRGSRRPLESA